ncbi:MAG TPA: hypothetical protein VMF91_10225 [Bryobacteraceae bacterium]|nr:hypothetical protein [Bryobacteraceae bacterium]
MTRIRILTLAPTMVCLQLLLGHAANCAAQTGNAVNGATPASAPCDVAGEVFGKNELDGTFLLKRDDTGVIDTIRYSKATNFVELSTAAKSEIDRPIQPAAIEIGDRLCVQRGDNSAASIFVLTRSEIQRQQVQVLTALHRNSVFGNIVRIDPTTHSVELSQIRTAGQTRTVKVDASGPVLFRRYAPDAPNITSVTTASWGDLRTGEQIYVRGQRNVDGTYIRAALIVLGGFRTAVGTVVSMDALHECLELKSVRSERPLKVFVQPVALFRISPFLPDGIARINTAGGQQGWKLHSLEFADLEIGDGVTVLIRASDPPDHLHALAVITGFGSFGLVPEREDEQILWLLDPLNLDLP